MNSIFAAYLAASQEEREEFHSKLAAEAVTRMLSKAEPYLHLDKFENLPEPTEEGTRKFREHFRKSYK